MFQKVRFDGNYVYSADEKNDFIGRIISGNNQFVEIIKSDGKQTRAYLGILDYQGKICFPCTNSFCLKACMGIPPQGLFCRYNNVSTSCAAFYVDI